MAHRQALRNPLRGHRRAPPQHCRQHRLALVTFAQFRWIAHEHPGMRPPAATPAGLSQPAQENQAVVYQAGAPGGRALPVLPPQSPRNPCPFDSIPGIMCSSICRWPSALRFGSLRSVASSVVKKSSLLSALRASAFQILFSSTQVGAAGRHALPSFNKKIFLRVPWRPAPLRLETLRFTQEPAPPRH